MRRRLITRVRPIRGVFPQGRQFVRRLPQQTQQFKLGQAQQFSFGQHSRVSSIASGRDGRGLLAEGLSAPEEEAGLHPVW